MVLVPFTDRRELVQATLGNMPDPSWCLQRDGGVSYPCEMVASACGCLNSPHAERASLR